LGIGLLDCGMRISDCGLKKPVFGVRLTAFGNGMLDAGYWVFGTSIYKLESYHVCAGFLL